MKKANQDALSEAIEACRKGFYAVALFSFCINLLMLTAPLYMLQIFDRVLSSRSGETLMVLTLVAALALLVLALLDSLRGIVLLRVGNWIDRRVSMEVLKASILAALRTPEGGSVQGLRDVATLRGFIAGPSVFPIMDAPWTPIFLIVTFVLHPVLGFIALAGAVLLFGLALLNELATRGPLKLSASAQIAALREAEAAIRNADAIEVMGMMPNLVQRWGRHNVLTLILQGEAGTRGSAVTAASKFLRLVLQIGIFASGAWLVIGGELTPGAMIAAAILMSRALAPVEQAIGDRRFAIVNVWRNIAREPVATRPLALCDAASVHPEELIVFEIHYKDRIGENYFAKHDPRHRWIYWSAMTCDEALLVKQWDSAGEMAHSKGARADAVSEDRPCTFSFHSAFEDPATPPDAPDRWSIEVRCAALYG